MCTSWLRAVLAVLAVTAMVGGIVTPALGRDVPAAAIAAGTPASYVALTPTRVLDTRNGSGQLAGLSEVTVRVTNRPGLPAGKIRAVTVNLTVTNGRSAGYLTAYSSAIRPVASSVNFQPGQTVANLATVPVRDDGTITVFNGAPAGVDLIVDVQVYFPIQATTPPGGFAAVEPRRVLDTRSGSGPIGTTGSVRVSVRGVPGAPTGTISAALINLTVTEPRADGYLLAFDGGQRPLASSLNYRAGQTVANTVVVAIAADGTMMIANDSAGSAHVVVDIQGYYLGGTPTAAGTYLPIGPRRLADTRTGAGVPLAPVGALGRLKIGIADKPGLPAQGISAVAINLTVTNPRADGFLTAAAGNTLPLASSVNFLAARTVANMVVVPVAPDGTITIHNGAPGSVDVVVDVLGYYRATDAVDEWPGQFGDAGNNRINLGEKQVIAAGAASVKQAWTAATATDPVARNGIVYSIGWPNGGSLGLVASDAATGAVRWSSSFPEGSRQSSGPLLLTGTTVIASYDSLPLIKLVAMSVVDGHVLWTSTVPNSVDSFCGDIVEMTADVDRLIVLKCQGEVQSFDIRTGASQWKVGTVDWVKQIQASHVTLWNHRLYVGFYGFDRGTEVWDPGTHNRMWSYPTRGNLPTVIADGRLLMQLQDSFSDQLQAYPATGCGAVTCAPLWSTRVSLPDGSRTTRAIVNGALGDDAFVTAVGDSNSAWLAPIDLSTGTIGRWWGLGAEDSATSGFVGVTRLADSMWMLADDELRAYPLSCGELACPELVSVAAADTTTVLHDHRLGVAGGALFTSRGVLDIVAYH